MRIGIVGGGITGLTCAYYLVRKGLRPTVFESERDNVARGIAQGDALPLDPFPMGLSRSDTAICGLIADLGLTHQLQWHRTPCGVYAHGETSPLTRWSDVLQFGGLTRLQRLGAAARSYAAVRLHTYAKPLDAIPVREWFSRMYGAPIYESFFRPALAARFGVEVVDELPAYVGWQFLREELLGAGSVTGILRGGLATLYDALVSTILEGGGKIQLDSRVLAIEGNEKQVSLDFGHGKVELDAVISAVKPPTLLSIAQGDLAGALAQPAVPPPMQEVSSLRLWLKGRSPLRGYYRMLMIDSEAPFPVLLDASSLVPAEMRQGRSLLYMTRTGPAGSKLPVAGLDAARELALRSLRTLDPHLDAKRIDDVALFEWQSPEPVWPVHSLRQPLPQRLAKSRVYVCTAAQAYPRGATPETAVMVARDCVGRFQRELAPA